MYDSVEEKLCCIVEMLKKSTRKTDKTAVLLENDCKELREFLKFLLDPRIVTGLSKTKINKVVPHSLTTEMNYLDFPDVCKMLKQNNTGTDRVIDSVQTYINSCPEQFHDFLKAALTKNLPIGLEAKTVNQIYGMELIPTWEVQQAYSIDKVKLKPNEWFSLSQKLNGNRCTIYRGIPMSRQGHEWTHLDHILQDLKNTFDDMNDLVFDGELIRKNLDGLSDNENFTIGTGILNSDTDDKTSIEFVVFDVIPVQDFDRGVSGDKYKARKKMLVDMQHKLEAANATNVRVVPMFYEGTDKAEIDKWLDYAVENNMEGLMLNRDVPYCCKRHNGILKVKRFYTLDLRVVGVERGSNRLAGTLGAIVVDFKGNKVNVGSGFDDETRSLVWNDPEKYIGSLACVKYKDISKDKKTGLESLQFPVFQCFRFDKDDVSYD